MSSDDSEDEPLSVLLAAKNANPEKYQISASDAKPVVVKKRQKKRIKRHGLTISLAHNVTTNLSGIHMPQDVWLYLKDFNMIGPYSCLLCPEWFLNRTKMAVHYVLNHRKPYCGICRYFVLNNDLWPDHLKFHSPRQCPQCTVYFDNDCFLRNHLLTEHNLIHCQYCHFVITGEEDYKTHLLRKHKLSDKSERNLETLWKIDYVGNPIFTCLLCLKDNVPTNNFLNHYFSLHKMTLKCFATFIANREPDFLISGIKVSPHYIETQLKDLGTKLGYKDIPMNIESEPDVNTNLESNTFLKALIPEIKQENFSDNENDLPNEVVDKVPVPSDNVTEEVKFDFHDYNGDIDFDITSTELIVLNKCNYDYVQYIYNDLKNTIVPVNSNILYNSVDIDLTKDFDCTLCTDKFDSLLDFNTHMNKMHGLRIVPTYSCRICMAYFDTETELKNHIDEELGEFEDLWLCQFCEMEFDSRMSTRTHLTQHISEIQNNNCFSPHMGFKCRYCPTLFWNEPDREEHQSNMHFNKYKEDFYKCGECSELFSDKAFFIHHYIKKHSPEGVKPSGVLFKCSLCCLTHNNIEEMREHFKHLHPDAKKIFCSLQSCKFRPFAQKKSFKFHVKCIHGRPERTEAAVACNVCGREFASSRACNLHITSTHGKNRFKCKLCNDVMQTCDERKLHYLIRHPGRHPFECTICNKSFMYKSTLYSHKAEHANKGSFTCEYCGKSFAKKDSYREHLAIHTGARHSCSFCPRVFVQRSNMLRHERLHTGERPYSCRYCDRTFSDKGACTSHARTHNKDRAFACLYCGQTFVQKSKLNYHIRKHTGENLETCQVCSKMFTSACSLREHMKCHKIKEFKYSCPLCANKYHNERNMIRHVRSVHGSESYSCPLCGRRLASLASVRDHVLTHADKDRYRCKHCTKTFAVKRSCQKHVTKRHGVPQDDPTINDHYDQLDVRDMGLALDEKDITRIFGPRIKTNIDVMLAACVKETTVPTIKKIETSNSNDEQPDSDSQDNPRAMTIETVNIKTEIDDGSEENDNEFDNELEPMNFVSVKVEPYDDDND